MCPFAEFCKPAIFLLALAALASAQDLPENAQRQIRALLSEKDSRNSAQVKMDSHLVHAAQILRGRPVSPDFPTPPGELESVHLDANSFVEVDIQADVTPALLALIRSVGGAVVSAFPEYESVRARLPLVSVERVAGLGEVRQIRTAAQAFVNTEGPDVVGDTAHQAITARPNFGLDGAGVKIGVISNGVNSLAAEQTALRLPAVNVIAGPAGSGDEGTAMLEIVYTLAPGATLYFATGNGGEAQMAANIQALATAGCSIIVDDLMYFAEGAFQDDTVSKAVDTVTAAGVFYFSAAGNNNSLKKSTSGTWQGDFLDSGTTLSTISAKESGSYAIHSFGAANYDTLTIPSTVSVNGGEGVYELMWSDPLGQSANDYDLFITDSSGNVLGSSTNVQNGREDPEEDITGNSTVSSKCASGTCHIIIVKHGGAATFARALFLSTERGELSIATSGATYGHSAAASAVTVAATNATYGDTAGCTGFATSCNGVLLGVESYSSDGPRQMFYNENGTAITPNNFLIGTGGGLSLSKPDITAADNINTGVSGFAPFTGTSAAAPHAAAIAALLLEAVPTLTSAAMRAALAASAVDIEGAPVPNINAGAGIVMAPAAIAAACGYSVAAVPSVAAAGGAAALSIQAGANCPWTVSGLPSWISGATSGKGPATVSLTVSANSGAIRSATFSLTAGTSTLVSASVTQGSPLGTSQTISFGALNAVTIGVAPFAVTATATSGLAVAFSSGTSSVCTVSGNTVTVVAAGVCSIVANQAGNATYASAPAVTRSFTVTAFGYLAGDAAPYTSDVAPHFGDGVLNILDLVQELFAVNSVPGFRPAACSDRFDAMDTYPADTSTTRGGDGVLDIRDLVLELFRVNNLDPSRPARPALDGALPWAACAGGSSGNSIGPTAVSRKPRVTAAAQGALALGRSEPFGAGEERVSVSLEATENLTRVAVTFALGDGQSRLRFVAAPGNPPPLVQDTQPGVVVAAFLNSISVPAGHSLVLGYVTGPAGALANLDIYGASASGVDDNREVPLAVLLR